MLVALEILFSLRKGKKASEFLNVFDQVPQVLENVVVKDKNIINSSNCKNAINKAKNLIKNKVEWLLENLVQNQK